MSFDKYFTTEVQLANDSHTMFVYNNVITKLTSYSKEHSVFDFTCTLKFIILYDRRMNILYEPSDIPWIHTENEAALHPWRHNSWAEAQFTGFSGTMARLWMLVYLWCFVCMYKVLKLETCCEL